MWQLFIINLLMGRKGKKKFTIPYIKYHLQPDLCQTVQTKYFMLKNDPCFNPRKIISKITKDHKVKSTTLRHWVKKWEEDISWDPYDTKNRGKCHRIFNDEQENNMMDYIEDNYIEPKGYFSNAQFQTLAFEVYDNLYRDSEDPPILVCSKNIISKFKTKYNVSSRLVHFKERNENYSEKVISEDINIFRATINLVI